MYKINDRIIKVAIFDLDGTLLDSLGVWYDIDIKFLSKRNLEVPSDYAKNISGLSFKQVAEYTVKYFNLKENVEDVMKEWFEMAVEEYSTNVLLKPYAKDYLRYVKDEGVRLCVATNLPASLSVPALKNNDVMDFFDAIYQPEDVGKSKNHPDLFLYCAKELNTNPESCIVFEDIPSNIQGAKKANMLTCGVYDSYSLYYQEDLKKLSDIYITSYKELLA